ncbi:MAG: hemin uptake protein HemP [Paracoccaceae bacterium]|jgi:hemin uptake protein HemP
MGPAILTVVDGKSASATIVVRRGMQVPTTPAVPVHDARKLLRGGTEARITLDAAIYTLRITRQGKLILTK